MQGNLNYRYKLFRTTEQIHVAGRFDLVPSQVDTYLVDSGQQANVMSLFAMDLELSQRFEGDDTRGHNTVYNYEKSYFELEAFLKDVGGLENFNEETATIVFIDIMQLAKFSFSKFKELKALVIDTTRQPEFNNKELKQIVKDAQKEGIWVVFTSSCLKHDELGQDKYTAGKITILAPKPEDKLDKSVLKELDGVSKDGRNIPVVSYLQMVNEICRDRPLGEVEAELNKNLQLKEKTKIGLQRYGLFAEKKDDEVATLNRTHRLQ
jgi:hypothetical protein